MDGWANAVVDPDWDVMNEIRDPLAAERHLLHGLVVSRAAPITPGRLGDALRWAKEIASQGSALPLLGFVADIGQLVSSPRLTGDMADLPAVTGLPATLTRRYEDYVLGKCSADATFQRGADAVLQYRNRDRDRAVAYVVERIADRARLPGTQLSPAVLNGFLKRSSAEVLHDAWASVQREGIDPGVLAEAEQLVSGIRNAGSLLGAEDVFELESGTALAAFGQRLALRQVLQTAETMGRELSQQRPRKSSRRYSVATNLQQEDQYPIGGFSSLSNRGTMESLVRSELAYMDSGDRPDLFDIKYSRNELLYYSRDENQFRRRHLRFVFVLCPDLVRARVKTDALPVQGVIVLLASLYVAVQQLTRWMSDDALNFEFLWISDESQENLHDERRLLETLFREAIATGTLTQDVITFDELPGRLTESGRQAYCQSLILSNEILVIDEAELPANTSCCAIGQLEMEQWTEQLKNWMELWCV